MATQWVKMLAGTRKVSGKGALMSVVAGFTLALSHVVMSAEPAQDPLFLAQPVRPLMMLNMSNDHQLFFKLYNDYSDLDGDGEADNTYNHSYDYYGYFDSGKCYSYDTSDNLYQPSRQTNSNGYCNTGSVGNEWSGNFLNWATMTRIDAVRKILYGGLRSTDTASVTVLERQMLPNDAHSFTKFYAGEDLDMLTPFGNNAGDSDVEDRGITICNTTDPDDRDDYSQEVTDPPLLRVARGNYSLWASNERWQCRWGTARNGNDPDVTNIYAHGSSPSKDSHGLGQKDYNVRVAVCDEGLEESNCQAYGSSMKPTGLLQEYGETDKILFGLMTGSYKKNKSGGVLRKNIGNMLDEINLDNGTFIKPDNDSNEEFHGIVNTLDKLRIYGYRFDNGTYHGTNDSDGCLWGWSSFDDGECTNWGNPQSELYLESLRYLSGLSASEEYNAEDSGYIDGLFTATWSAPVDNNNYCAPLSVLQFNASTSSYDGDQVKAIASDIGVSDVDSITDQILVNEGLAGNDFYVGKVLSEEGVDNEDELCTAKTVGNLSKVRGTCPDAPRLEGSYYIAGLAHYARSTGISLSGVTATQNKPKVKTYGVALAPSVPSVSVKVPGSDIIAGSEAKFIDIQPACRNEGLDANCAIVDFKIIEQTTSDVANSGLLYVNWEDSEQGGDFDQDMWGVMKYKVTNNEVTVGTQVIAQSTGDIMGFGYIISGTKSDGFHVHSGVNDFVYGDFCKEDGDCTCHQNNGTQTCNLAELTERTYDVGASSAQPLEQPLYYAAKWGGYFDDKATVDDIREDDTPDSYFYATDPRKLQEALRNVFDTVSQEVGAAASVATESAQLSEGGYIYQAKFDSKGWSGEIEAFEIDENGVPAESATVSTNETLQLDNENGRKVYTYVEDTGTVAFTWGNLSADQKSFLNPEVESGLGEKRLNWLRGDQSHEGDSGGLREREKLLGDIVNSSPVYLSSRDRGYSRLPDDEGGGNKYQDYLDDKENDVPTLFVGANDGMLHAFYGSGSNLLRERFAYVPTGVYPKLAKLSDPNYGRQDVGHEYLVDGPLVVGDAYLNGAWKSVLVGTLGAGGKSIFALDVTQPDSPKVLFELNQSDYSALGYVMGDPTITRTVDGRWVVIFGNGYDSGTSQLFVVDLEDPLGSTEVINTQAGTGLSGVSVLRNGDGEAVYAYGGDLNGNLWKFDLNSSNTSQWQVALGGNPLFIAKDDNGVRQPISSAPALGYNSLKGGATMLYFGTGKYFDDGDNNWSAGDSWSSFYGIADTDVALTYSSRTDIMHEKTLSQSGEERNVNGEGVDWTEDDGWYLDFDVEQGERVIQKPLLLFDRLIFPTVIPSAVACDYGGRSWLMELVGVGDRFTRRPVLKPTPSDLILGEPTPTYTEGGDDDSLDGNLLYMDTSGGRGSSELDVPDDALGRQSWRQVR
ncbi:pilus assembly protein [Marinimicrobium agarilyticum]|uniref:pilus assembly protein n=1 Tax=Marinimicrobium agarilyticum TaxID=306546 RepID=UPI0004224E61|nr:PilC/PilY family type IV pilus protein [Marinimicrobium agarilyticum]